MGLLDLMPELILEMLMRLRMKRAAWCGMSLGSRGVCGTGGEADL